MSHVRLQCFEEEKLPPSLSTLFMVKELLKINNTFLNEDELAKLASIKEKNGYHHRSEFGLNYSVVVDGKNTYAVFRNVKADKPAILGSGGTSTSKLLLNHSSDAGELIVMKTLKPTAQSQVPGYERAFKIEAEILEKLGRARAKPIESINRKKSDFKKLRIFMKLEEGVKLSTLIDSKKLPKDPEKLLQIAKNFLKELEILHKLGYVHRDIKTDNVFVNPATNEVILHDFGSAGRLAEGTDFTYDATISSTPINSAPENKRENYSTRADIYSAGLVLMELLFGEKKTYKASKESVVSYDELYELYESDTGDAWQICEKETDGATCHYELSQEVYSIVEKMISENPKNRTTLKEVSDVISKHLAPELTTSSLLTKK